MEGRSRSSPEIRRGHDTAGSVPVVESCLVGGTESAIQGTARYRRCRGSAPIAASEQDREWLPSLTFVLGAADNDILSPESVAEQVENSVVHDREAPC